MVFAALELENETTADSEQDLVKRVAARDEQALAALYDRFSSVAFAVATRVIGDRAEAEDVLQTVFVKLWQEAARYDASKGSVGTWILSAIRNASIDRIRRRDAYRQATQRAAEQAPPPITTPPPATEEHARVSKAVEQLPKDQKEAIELAYFQGMSQTEIAEKLAQPLGTVKTRIRLGMMRLRQALQGRPETA